MSFFSTVNASMVNVPVGVLPVGLGAGATTIRIDSFDLQDSAVTVAQWMDFLRGYGGQPYARFERTPGGHFRMTHMAPSEGAFNDIFVTAVPGEPIPLSWVFRVVPTEEEYERRFTESEGVVVRKGESLEADRPAIFVTYFEAAAFAACGGWRLPTRQEREYAARCGREGDVYGTVDGTLRDDNAHWSAPRHKKNATTKVKSCPPTHWGHYDLAGGVSEWVSISEEEAHQLHVRKGREDREVWGAQGVCGGSWFASNPEIFLAASCGLESPKHCSSRIGFRVARSVSQDSSIAPRTGKAGCFGAKSGANPDSPPNPHRGNISAKCGDVTGKESTG